MPASDYLRDARVVIVGAGVIGATLAYRLAQAGAAVTVVERRHTVAGTSGATFAWLNAFDKPPRDYHRLNAQGVRDHEDLADELGGDWCHVTGTVHWAPASDTRRRAALDTAARQLLAWGARADRLDAHALREAEPDLRPDLADAAVAWHVPRSGWLDPMALATAALAAAGDRYGATVIHGEVTGLSVARGVIERVVLADGTSLEADVVVNAAGPDAGAVAALAGAPLPVERTPGLLLVTPPVPARLRGAVVGPELHARPDGGSRLLLQWDPLDVHADDPEAPAPDDPRLEPAIAAARDLVPALAAVPRLVERVRRGVRPVPRDGFPVAGFDPAVANLYHLVTHSGVTLAARLALLVTEELTGGDAMLLEPYRPTRFAHG
jgi:glycine/D-amino acid oxidase-like deaminating enzyme